MPKLTHSINQLPSNYCQDKILSVSDVCRLVNRSKRTIWRWYTKEKLMPRPMMVQGTAIGWRESVIYDWLKTIEEKSNLQVQTLSVSDAIQS